MTTAIGLDLSLTATGVASTSGWCTTIGRDGLLGLPLEERIPALRNLKWSITAAIGTPDMVCVETPAFSRSGGGTFERGWLWFEVLSTVLGRQIPVVEVGPTQLKQYATGRGLANKGAVLVEVTKRWPMFDTGGDDNLADAAVLAAIGAELLGAPLAQMPTANRQVLAKLRVPGLVDVG